MSAFYWTVRAGIRLTGRLLFGVRAIGLENVPPTGGCLLVANHASNLDPPIIATSIDRICHTLAKRELFEVPLLGWAISHLYAHPIDRGGVDRRALRECVECLRRGEVLLLFPEGTRTSDGSLQSAKAGAAMIAVQAGVPIVPVYIDGTFEALPRGRSWPRLSKIEVRFGAPFMPADVLGHDPAGDRRASYERLAAEMMARIGRLSGASAHPPE
jgi:1-acyl-sn-glycerol-3-phosphate acyltransferase